MKGKDDTIVVLDKITGEVLQRFKVNKFNPRIILSNEFIYGRTVGEYLYKIDKQTGDTIWKVKCAPSTPIIVDNILYFYDFDKKMIIALETETGNLVWEQEILNYSALQYIATSSYLFVSRDDGTLYGFDKKTGEKLWELTDYNNKNFLYGYI